MTSPPYRWVRAPRSDDAAVLFPSTPSHRAIWHLTTDLRPPSWWTTRPAHRHPDGVTLCGINHAVHPGRIVVPVWVAVRAGRLCHRCKTIAGLLVVEDPGPLPAITTRPAYRTGDAS